MDDTEEGVEGTVHQEGQASMEEVDEADDFNREAEGVKKHGKQFFETRETLDAKRWDCT